MRIPRPRNRRVVPIAAAVALASITIASAARGSLKQQSEDFDRRITSELAARDATAADLFTRAGQARDRGDFDVAADLYERVRKQAPWFSHATRRLCGVEGMRGHHDRAIALCREAVAADPSPTNDAALARELLASPPPGPGEDDVQEAYGRARRAADNAPTDAFVQLVLCNAATAAKQFEVLDHCSRSLKVIDPDTATTLYFATLDDVAHDRLDRALSDLERAHQLGLPGDQYRNLRRAIEDSRWPLGRYGRIATYALVGWLAAGALLLGFAAILSGSRWRRFRARRARRGAMRAASNRLSVARIASCFG